MKRYLLLLPALLLTGVSLAQEDQNPSPVTISGYLETYYLFDFNQPENNTRPEFVYAFNRHNEVNLNLGFVKASYNADAIRASLALMAGTYPNANLAAEPGVLKNILEANAGVKISSTKNLWMDAGIFASHIGFESAIGKDAWGLTRSMAADNSPYYEAGAKLSYTSDDDRWYWSALLLNGWQRIQRMDGNSLPAFGTQVTFKPTTALTLNSSSFCGTDTPDSTRQMRYFHNFYGIATLSDRVRITFGFDYGLQQTAPKSNRFNTWFSPVIVARVTLTETLSVDVRAEYYEDASGVIISTGTPNGFKTTGLSANVDYHISPHAIWRMELRHLNSVDPVFTRDAVPVKNNTFVTTSLAISF